MGKFTGLTSVCMGSAGLRDFEFIDAGEGICWYTICADFEISCIWIGTINGGYDRLGI